MSKRQKSRCQQPIDRAMRDLEGQLNQIKKEIRSASSRSPAAVVPATMNPPGAGATMTADRGTRGPRRHLAPRVLPANMFARAIKRVFQPAQTNQGSERQPSQDLFDIAAIPAQRIEMDQFAFGDGDGAPSTETSSPELFALRQSAPQMDSAAQALPAAAKHPQAEYSKLAHYLSAGGIRSYKPLRRVQRQDRNRFFAWMGLAVLAVWILYVVLR